MTEKMWFEGVKHETLIFTEEDLGVVLRLLDERRVGLSMSREKNEFDRVFDRIMFQKMKK
jgi:hypothetical protein